MELRVLDGTPDFCRGFDATFTADFTGLFETLEKSIYYFSGKMLFAVTFSVKSKVI